MLRSGNMFGFVQRMRQMPEQRHDENRIRDIAPRQLDYILAYAYRLGD
jgi:hypothetical protein